MTFSGTNKIGSIFSGTTGISKVYSGISLVWQKEAPTPSYPYLCFTANTAGSTVKLSNVAGTYKTSFDGVNWTDYTLGSTLTLSEVGSKVYFAARTTNSTCYASGTSNRFEMTGSIAASGNIMYMLSFTNPPTAVPQACFTRFFANLTALTSAPELPATTVNATGYQYMFYLCTNLTGSIYLPATTLGSLCYTYMLSLSKIQSVTIEAVTLKTSCFYCMMHTCRSLTYLEVHFPDWTTGCTRTWVSNVAGSGTFKCPSALPVYRGNDYVPTNFTVVKF